MNGTFAYDVPTSGSCLKVLLQDQAIHGQDPDITTGAPAGKLSAMPSPSPFQRLARWSAQLFRTLAGPSSPSPATGRSTVRLPVSGRSLGFREFTAPRRALSAAALPLRVKSAAFSTRIVSRREGRAS
ncbi:hypothetical protein OVA13_10905 [Pseudoxanthomonas sp. SL93]|uniref:hypothetical protein n=1 Tax=Pseudoxanthomonas sp. SL93 TaxID=2995142 RepID=UPI0022721E41|nr:hypothetical protein [Pseudoxanthomonas sp. SL93]WAC61914.1 hypothetical protein OVA13_10905 [Pseudoxanthomonas sp. SL93]